MGNAVAHRFDEDGLSAVFERHAASSLSGFSHGEDVVTVYADSVDPIAYTTAGDAIAAVLLDSRGGDCEPVVAADEHYGAGARGCYVESGVEVAFAGGAFAEVACYYSVGEFRVLQCLEFEGVGCTDCLWYLGSERRGYGVLDRISALSKYS